MIEGGVNRTCLLKAASGRPKTTCARGESKREEQIEKGERCSKGFVL